MAQYEVDFLDDYSEESLLNELRRVAADHPGRPLSKKDFDQYSKRVSATTLRRRFGGWESALSRAGLEHLYTGRKVSKKMREQPAKLLSDEGLLAELRRVCDLIGTGSITRSQFNAHSITCYTTIRKRFGWEEALRLAGIEPSPHAKKNWTTEQCFENLAATWTFYGRPPTYREMSREPSKVTGKAYVLRWGTWRRALTASTDWANAGPPERQSENPEPNAEGREPSPQPTVRRPETEKDNRNIGARLRFRVFQRDKFRCIVCGRSPATHLNLILHADHIIPVARGGKTVFENLQTLCQDCNLGKGTIMVEAQDQSTTVG